MRITLEHAAELLLQGHVVAVPTETVYGLAASIHHPHAIEQIFSLKGRPSSNPLIVHVCDVQTVKQCASDLPSSFASLTQAFWPGPMTLVLKANTDQVPSIVRAGLPTAAFRFPQHPVAQRLIALTGPLVMPSANLSGSPSATAARHVESDFGLSFPVLEGNNAYVGVESTILVYLDGLWQIIRQGALPPAAFEPVLGYLPAVRAHEGTAAPLCPGQLFRHYAPKTHLRLDLECSKAQNSTILGYSDRIYHPSNQVISLGSSSDPHQIAESLYAALRLLDERCVEAALVDIDLPHYGLYSTLHERLAKAAAGDTESAL